MGTDLVDAGWRVRRVQLEIGNGSSVIFRFSSQIQVVNSASVMQNTMLIRSAKESEIVRTKTNA